MSKGEKEIEKTPTTKRLPRRSLWTAALVAALIAVLLATAVRTEVTTALKAALKTAATTGAGSKSFLFSNRDKSCQCSSQVFFLYFSLQVRTMYCDFNFSLIILNII